VRNEFRGVERLRGMKCFPGGETQFVGNTDSFVCIVLSLSRALSLHRMSPFKAYKSATAMCAKIWGR